MRPSAAPGPQNCLARTRHYRDGQVVDENFSVERISDVLEADDDSVVWLDLLSPTEQDLHVVVEEFGLHPLAVEDALHERQRPKLDRYASHLFMTVYSVRVDDGAEPRTRSSEISVFVTKRALITVHDDGFDVEALMSRWDLDIELAKGDTVRFLLYGLLDDVVDGHYAAIEELEACAEDLEDQLFAPQADTDIRRRGFLLRRALAELRRVVAPMHEVVGRLLRNDMHLEETGLAPYFHDVYDHVQRTAEAVDSARDLITSILEANLTEQSNQLNQITKKLAAWAAIIAVPTAVTGFYGQNVPYPGFSSHTGFITSLVIMIVLAGGLWLLLRKQHWL